MDYSNLSDRDIDALVLHKIYGNQASDADIMRSWSRGGFKYTTNPAEAWPIIADSKISLLWVEETSMWCASAGGSAESEYWGWDECPDHHYEHPNSLRAAMVCFLML